jgi:D-xylose transport system substrate-binding protein
MDNFHQERWAKDRDYFCQHMNKLGGKVFVEDAKGDPFIQLAQANKLINKNVDVLVIVPVDAILACRIIQNAKKNDVKVIAYDRLISGCNLDFYISFDSKKVGQLQSDYLLKKVSQGNYVLINGPERDNNSKLLRQGQLEQLTPSVDNNTVQILYNVHADSWKQDQGYVHMLNVFQIHGKNVDAVIAGNDALARGAIEAMQEYGLADSIEICGQDAELSNVRMIINGIQSMTVYKPLKHSAEKAAEVAYRLARNENCNLFKTSLVDNNYKLVPSLLLEPKVVDKNNVLITVLADEHLNIKHFVADK